MREYLEVKKNQFLRAKATNTRMMGVVGLVCEWLDSENNITTQIFHLDYEAYGIDGFHNFISGDSKEINRAILGVAGGLGGKFIPISYEEYVFLIKSAYIVDPASIEALVDFEYFVESFDSLYAALSIEDEIALYEKLCPDIESPIELLNYFIMRVVGCDYKATMLLWKNGEIDIDFELTEEPYTLLKNKVIEKRQKGGIAIYSCEALIDFENKYKIIFVNVEVELSELKILNANVAEKLEISSVEASFNLNKPEYMSVYSIRDEFFERRFSEQNPEMIKYDYYNGRLYTEFNPTNDHVKENPYYLNGDIFVFYFFTDRGQLIVGTLKRDNIDVVENTFEESYAFEESLTFICEVKTDYPVLYSFMNSAYENIFDFLENWRD